MDEGQIKDLIAQLTVRVKAPGKKEDGKTFIEKGTGVLLLQDNRAYVLTVYHCIYGKKEPFHTPNKEDIKFSFLLDICPEVINPIKVTPLQQNLVLMEIDIQQLNKTDMKCHYLDRVYDREQYYLRGFPESEVHNFKAKCNDKDFDETTFKIDVDKLTADTRGESAIHYVSGLSGSGVFFSKYNQLYLVGLVNKLRDRHGRFDSVHSTKLIDLYNSDIEFSQFYAINDISKKLKSIENEVSKKVCMKFEEDNTEIYSNLDRKHNNVWHRRDVPIKNFQAIKDYLQGKNSINQIKLLDSSFEEHILTFSQEVLNNIESYISKYVDDKKEARDNLKIIREKTIESIVNDLNLIQKDTYISNKLREYIVVGWLLNCNIDFKIDEEE